MNRSIIIALLASCSINIEAAALECEILSSQYIRSDVHTFIKDLATAGQLVKEQKKEKSSKEALEFYSESDGRLNIENNYSSFFHKSANFQITEVIFRKNGKDFKYHFVHADGHLAEAYTKVFRRYEGRFKFLQKFWSGVLRWNDPIIRVTNLIIGPAALLHGSATLLANYPALENTMFGQLAVIGAMLMPIASVMLPARFTEYEMTKRRLIRHLKQQIRDGSRGNDVTFVWNNQTAFVRPNYHNRNPGNHFLFEVASKLDATVVSTRPLEGTSRNSFLAAKEKDFATFKPDFEIKDSNEKGIDGLLSGLGMEKVPMVGQNAFSVVGLAKIFQRFGIVDGSRFF